MTFHQHLVIVSFHIVKRIGNEEGVPYKQIESLAAKWKNTNIT